MTPHRPMAFLTGSGNDPWNCPHTSVNNQSLLFTALLFGSFSVIILVTMQVSGESIDPNTLQYADPDVLGDNYLYVTNEGKGGGGETLISIWGNGTGTEVRDDFFGPSGLAIFRNSTTMYASDDLGSVYSLSLHGIMDHVHERSLDNPNGLAFDDGGRLLIADAGSRILRTNLTSGSTEVLAEEFMIPQAIVCHGDSIFFTDHNGHIYVIGPGDPFPMNSSTVGKVTNEPVVFGTQGGLVMWDDGSFFVSDFQNGRVLRVFPDGSSEEVIQFTDCHTRGLILTPDHTSLLVTSYNTNQIFVLNLLTGNVAILADNTTTGNRLNGPFGMALSRHDFTNGIVGENLETDDDSDRDGDYNWCECPDSPAFDILLPFLEGEPVSSDDVPILVSPTRAFNLTITVRNPGEEIDSFIVLPLMCEYGKLTDTGGDENELNGSGSNLLPGINMSYLREFLNGTDYSPWNVTFDSIPVAQGIPAGMCGSMNVSISPKGQVSGEYFLLIVVQSLFHEYSDHVGLNVSVDGKAEATIGGTDDGSNNGETNGHSSEDDENPQPVNDDQNEAPLGSGMVFLSVFCGLVLRMIHRKINHDHSV